MADTEGQGSRLEVVDDYDKWASRAGWCKPLRATPRTAGLPCLGNAAEKTARLLGYPGLWGWQRHVLDVATEVTEQDVWRWRRVAVIVPRQNGKTSLLSVLSALFLRYGYRIMYAAQSREQAYRPWLEAIERIQAGMPGLINYVTRGAGREFATSVNGGYLRLGTPSAKAIRGSVLDIVLLDEALELAPDFVATIRPTQTTRKDAQTWYLSSAGHHKSEVLRKVREQNILMKPPHTTALFEWAADPGEATSNAGDRAVWHSCIPTLGQPGGARYDAIESAQQDMTEEEFAREYLGVWSESKDDKPIRANLWAHARRLGKDGTIVGRVVFGVDVAPNQSYAAITAAGLAADDRLRIEVVEHRKGVAWLSARLRDLCREHRPAAVIADERSPAATLFDGLTRQGWPLEKIDYVTLIRACARLVEKLESGQLQIGESDALDAAAETAERRQVAGGWAFKRGRNETDISALVSAVLALDKAATLESAPLITIPRPYAERAA